MMDYRGASWKTALPANRPSSPAMDPGQPSRFVFSAAATSCLREGFQYGLGR